MNIYNRTIGIALWAVLAAGCGGAAVPHAQSAETEASVRAAEAVGAADVPDGALHLKYARDQVAEANKLIAAGENEEAVLVLRRAESDANLALALARAEAAQQAAVAAEDRIDQLKERPKGAGGS
jgi:hypothetical protein